MKFSVPLNRIRIRLFFFKKNLINNLVDLKIIGKIYQQQQKETFTNEEDATQSDTTRKGWIKKNCETIRFVELDFRTRKLNWQKIRWKIDYVWINNVPIQVSIYAFINHKIWILIMSNSQSRNTCNNILFWVEPNLPS